MGFTASARERRRCGRGSSKSARSARWLARLERARTVRAGDRRVQLPLCLRAEHARELKPAASAACSRACVGGQWELVHELRRELDRNEAIYSGFAIVLVAMLWLHLSWLISAARRAARVLPAEPRLPAARPAAAAATRNSRLLTGEREPVDEHGPAAHAPRVVDVGADRAYVLEQIAQDCPRS